MSRLDLRPCRSVAPAAVLCVASLSALGAQTQGPRFEPGDCPFPRAEWMRDSQLECGWLVAPEVRERPGGRTVRLAVGILRARQPDGSPPLVMLHGGPGASGLRIYTRGVSQWPIAKYRDIVIYDQRGAGFSRPTLCPRYHAAAEAASELPTLAEREHGWNAAARACIDTLHAQGIEPAAYNTEASAADLIDLRRALGYTTWDVYGGSYGARLAQEAMRQDSSAIHSVILASPVTRGPTREAESPLSMQRAIERVFAACAAEPACRAAFPKAEGEFYALYDELTAAPLVIPQEQTGPTADSVRLDGRRLINIIRNRFLSRPGQSARLPFLLHELRRGDRVRAARVLIGADTTPGGNGDQVLVHLVNCFDVYGPAYRAAFDSINAKVRSPFRGLGEMDDCDLWQKWFANPSAQAPVRSGIPTLLLTGRFDDRTPTEHARRIAATLGRGYVVELPNEGHGARPLRCHLSILLQFLEHPLQEPDVSCIATIPPIRFATSWDGPAR